MLKPSGGLARPLKVPTPFPPHALDACPPERAFRFLHKDHYAPWLREVVGDAPLARRVEAFAASGAAASALQGVLAGLARTRLEELRRARGGREG